MVVLTQSARWPRGRARQQTRPPIKRERSQRSRSVILSISLSFLSVPKNCLAFPESVSFLSYTLFSGAIKTQYSRWISEPECESRALCQRQKSDQRNAARGDDRIELAADPQARRRGIGDQHQAFAGEVADDGEDTG